MFCREYLIDLNATQAAIRAGFSIHSAKNQASNLLREPHIKNRLAELKTARNERAHLNADYVLKRLLEIDKMDAKDILNDDGSAKPIHDWPDVWRQSISGVDLIEISNSENVATTLKKIKWPDKIKNLELLGRHFAIGAFKDRLEVSGNIGLAERVKKARERSGK